MVKISLECNCGLVKGVTLEVSANVGNRVVCYCNDCQSFASQLKTKELILNEYGGTDVFQLPISFIKITDGIENIGCMKLRPNGLFRWYTKCCETPIGNTLSPNIPFIGVFHNFMKHELSREHDIGEILCHSQTKYSSKPLPKEIIQNYSTFRILLRSLSKIVYWKFKGLGRPNVFFDNEGKPISSPLVLGKK